MTELERLLSKTVEVGDCLEWTGRFHTTGAPIVFEKKAGNHKGTYLLTRRAIYKAICCGPLQDHRKFKIVATCDNPRCVNPEHLARSTPKKIAKKAAKAGAFRSLQRRARIAAAKRKTGKLTMALANEIRMSTDTGPVLALRYGIDKSLVNRIKRGDAWSPSLGGGYSVFSAGAA